MLPQIADLHLCVLMSLRPYVFSPLCPCALMSCALLSAPLYRVLARQVAITAVDKFVKELWAADETS